MGCAMDSCNQQRSTFDTVSRLRHAQRSALFGFGNRLDAEGEVTSGRLSPFIRLFSPASRRSRSRSLIPFFLAHRLVINDVLPSVRSTLSRVAPLSPVADEPGRSVTSAQGRVPRASRKYGMRNCTRDEGAPSSSHGSAPKVERGQTTDIRGANSKLQRSKLKPPQYKISSG